MAKRSFDDQPSKKQRGSREESLTDCMERLNNDDSLFGNLYSLSYHLNCKKTRKKLHAFMKLVKTSNKKNMGKIKWKYNKCVEAVENMIMGVDDVMKVFNRENTDQKDRKTDVIESDKVDDEINQLLIKLLNRKNNFFEETEELLNELQTYRTVEIRTDLKGFVKLMKAEQKRNICKVGQDCVEMYKHCVCNWKKSRSTAENIKKILVGDGSFQTKSDGSGERNAEEPSVAEHSPRKLRRTSASASVSDVEITIENDKRTPTKPCRDVKAIESETSQKTQENTSQDVAEERQAKERTYLHHKGVAVQEVGNGIQALSPAEESELNYIKKEVESLKTELQMKESRVQEFAGLLEERETETNAIKKELQTNNDNHNRKIKKLEGLVDEQKQQIEKEKREKKESERRLAEQKQETEAEQKKKEDALIRLSEMTSMQLRSNNPNIVDLSDVNRPTKIGEQLSELYDGEWTDAFENLIKEKSERESIKILHDIIMDAHKSCLGLSSVENMLKSIETEFLQGPSSVDVEVRQKLVDLRKRNASISLENVTKKLKPNILSELDGGSSSEALNKYVDACIKICWFMAVQDPPLRLYNAQRKEFDKEKYREYTQRGKYTDFVVWPALCLHEGGALLAKGIAQGSKVPIEEKPPKPVSTLEPTRTDNDAQDKNGSPQEKTDPKEKHSPTEHSSSTTVTVQSVNKTTMGTNETTEQRMDAEDTMRYNTKGNALSETGSSDEQRSSKQLITKIDVIQTDSTPTSIRECGKNLDSADTLNNESKSVYGEENTGHRGEKTSTDGMSKATEGDNINEEDASTKF